jgi:hypothetical protein
LVGFGRGKGEEENETGLEVWGGRRRKKSAKIAVGLL